MNMVEVRMTMDEYLQLISGLSSETPSREMDAMQSIDMKPKKRKMTAYQRRYKANFKKIEADYKLKNGNWRKNGFKNAVKAAHAMSKK